MRLKETTLKKIAAIALLLATGGMIVAGGQASMDPKLLGQLKLLFPGAAFFSPKEGDPPHFKAFTGKPGPGQALIGYAFWTTELEPLERGYDGPIKMLVGLDPRGILAGILVVEHREPYGNFSVDQPRFPEQFRGKNIRDPFKVGSDIDAVSRATLTVTSSTRAVRNSARRVARALLTPPETGK